MKLPHIHWHRRQGWAGRLLPTPIYVCRCGSTKYGVMW